MSGARASIPPRAGDAQAAAVAARAAIFITNDRRLWKQRIEGIGIMAGLDISVY